MTQAIQEVFGRALRNTEDAYNAKYHLDPVVFEDALKLAVYSEDY
jgi:hypothetical protein